MGHPLIIVSCSRWPEDDCGCRGQLQKNRKQGWLGQYGQTRIISDFSLLIFGQAILDLVKWGNPNPFNPTQLNDSASLKDSPGCRKQLANFGVYAFQDAAKRSMMIAHFSDMALKAVFASCLSLTSWVRLDSMCAIEFRNPGR